VMFHSSTNVQIAGSFSFVKLDLTLTGPVYHM
jgi:hypothetical protein